MRQQKSKHFKGQMFVRGKHRSIDQKRPCLIVSSARSGSKLLRELLMQSGQFNCYPYDINYIWMKGYINRDNDELKVEDYQEKNARYIRSYLGKLIKRNSETELRILEKTVSNALRLEYVMRVLPDAQVIHLVRDGREATVSIHSCWTKLATSEKNQSRKLLFKKLVNFPFSSAFPYLVRYLKSNSRLLLGRKSASSWGPRIKGIGQMLVDQPLLTVCAHQWARSIELTSHALKSSGSKYSYVEVKYEDLIADPGNTINGLVDFLRLPDHCAERMTVWATNNFRQNTACWEAKLTDSERLLVMPILEEGLSRYGYK